MSFQVELALGRPVCTISNPNRLTFFSDNNLKKNIMHIKKANKLSANFESKYMQNESDRSNFGHSLSTSFLPISHSQVSSSLPKISCHEPNNKKKFCKESRNKALLKNSGSFLEKQSKLRLDRFALKYCSKQLVHFNSSNISNIKSQKGNDNEKQGNEQEVNAIYKTIFNKKLSLIFNAEKIRELVSNDPMVYTQIRNPITTEKSIFKSLEAFVSQSVENKRIIDVKDKLYFIKGLTEYLLPKAEKVVNQEKKVLKKTFKSPFIYNTNSKSVSRDQLELESNLRLFDYVHSNKKSCFKWVE